MHPTNNIIIYIDIIIIDNINDNHQSTSMIERANYFLAEDKGTERESEGLRKKKTKGKSRRRRRSAQTPGVPTPLPLEPASKTPPCRHPGEITAWGGQPRFPAVATSAPGPGCVWPTQDRNIMPTGSSFHPARVYRVLRASFSHSGNAFASVFARRGFPARQFPARRFSAREFRALVEMSLSPSPNFHLAVREISRCRGDFSQ